MGEARGVRERWWMEGGGESGWSEGREGVRDAGRGGRGEGGGAREG